MDTEASDTVVNGSHETDIELSKDEKVLKPRKSVISNDVNESVIQNGNNENGSTSDDTENENVQNGFDNNTEIIDNDKLNGKRSLQEEEQDDKKESTTKRSKREPRAVKEATPKPETPNKRELRRREATPRESTPKPEIHELRRRGTPLKDHSVEKNLESKTSRQEEKKVTDASKLKRDEEELCEASTSSPSVICLGTPSIDEHFSLPDKDIKGRKPLNSFSRFPGRNVSIISLDDSLKRKAEDSFDNEQRKRFAGETESGSEKSPGWNFFSSAWSPASLKKKSLLSSTPFNKKKDQDSMAVNYNEETKMSLEDTADVQVDTDVNGGSLTSTTKPSGGKWCTVM